MVGAIFLSIFDWWYSSHGHSDIQLAVSVSRRTPVLFVNSIGLRMPRPGSETASVRRIVRKIASIARPTQLVADNLTVMTPLSAPIYDGQLARLNAAGVSAQIAGAGRRLNLARPLVFVTVPTYAPVALSLPRRGLVYLRSDRHSAYPGANGPLLERYERRLFETSDAVLYSNRKLYETEAGGLGGRAMLIGHGVDLDLFSRQGTRDPQVTAIPGPRVGFFGELRARSIDFHLIAEAAKLRPEIAFVLGGTQLDALGEFRALPNVHILPPCAHAEMPARWRALDLAILPYKQNDWSDATEPVKLREILAIGLRAVATPLPCYAGWDEEVSVAQAPADFVRAIDAQLAYAASSDRPSRRAGLRTWDEIAAQLLAIPASSLPLPQGEPA